ADARYSRQVLLPQIGEAGQQRLADARVLLVGCGALGSVLADVLVRAGVGQLCICDRDVITLDNLQRQILFDETDVEAGLPKAEAARVKLQRINSGVQIEAHVLDVNHTNLEQLAQGAQIILDGTDNFETRYLINDLAVKSKRPWVYGAVIGVTGLCMPIVPGGGPCLRCVFPEPPPPEMSPTCDTVGVLASAVNIVASLQATEALKILIGKTDELNRGLTSIDVWSGRWITVNAKAADDGTCPCCTLGRFDYLDGTRSSSAVSLCGRQAVQITRHLTKTIDFDATADKLRRAISDDVYVNPFLLRVTLEGCTLTLFRDGRAIIHGTADVSAAKSLYSRYVGA
ncbi:MAG: thiazole biosynthesis adenylyltransferase ThiF, partial [bacterium]|nr:thiazole biosynthesis adenylyltransferase ThiF [bacterium]